jgi:hypothetical protein
MLPDMRIATALVSVLAAAAVTLAAQAPRKARAGAPRAHETAHFSGSIVELRGKALPDIDTTIAAFFARSGEEVKRFIIRFTDEPGAPPTKVTRGGKPLDPDATRDALNVEGLHVEVDYEPEPYRDTEAFLATSVEIGEIEMANDSTGIPADLVIEEIQEGTGAVAEPGRTVSVHYTGWLRDGTKFDSSVDRNEPFQFRLGAGQVIRGWDRGVAGMKVGGKRRLIIPPDLGYGARGAGGLIPPNAVLVFEVELLGVR